MEGTNEKATEIYEKLQVYDWCEKNGYMPNDSETKKKCYYMLNEIIDLYGNKDYGEVAWWKEVKLQVKHL